MKFLALTILACAPFILSAQTVHQELVETVRATVLDIVHEDTREIIGTDTTAVVQEVRVRIEEGARAGDVVTFENDLTPLEDGESIFVNRLVTIDGEEYYTFKDSDRRWALFFLAALFVAVLVSFSGFHGVRALLSLMGSIGLIFFVLVPALLSGYPIVLTSVLVSGFILAFVLYSTHGFHARTTIAFLGTLGAVIITGILGAVWVHISALTGLSSDAAIYLNFGTHGTLDFSGLLLGSIIIGVLGVLDDVAITQASVTEELMRANGALSPRALYAHALKVGRDHIGSLVNTLALAYIGVSLPLVLLLAQAGSSIMLSLNQELVAAELIRTLVGSIGLVLAVPLTTLIAVWWYTTHPVDQGREGAHHVHSH